MIRAARWSYLVLAWAFVIGLTVQVFLAGLGIFAGAANLATHVEVGWVLHLVPLLILGAAALSRAGRRHWTWALALAVVVFVVPIFATLRADAPVLAALHPVGAMVAFWLSIVVARQALEVIRAPASAAPEPAAAEATTA